MADVCTHLDMINNDVKPTTNGCAECLKIGATWFHLRLCMTCGVVLCCDSSEHKHASKHAAESGHPVVLSLEPGDDWMWCYVDEVYVDLRP